MTDEKTALITGANKGIGLEVARQLAQQGLRIILSARNVARGQEACAQLCRSGAKAEFLELDVSDRASIAAACRDVRKRVDKLHVLVNNAGILRDTGPAIKADADDVLHTFETNTLGPLLLIQELWPLLAKDGGGRIINVASGMAGLAEMGTGYAGYRISKTGLNAVTRIFSNELAAYQVQVNSVCPGWVRTDMGGKNANLSIEDGADTIVWLATEAPEHITGQFLRQRQPLAW